MDWLFDSKLAIFFGIFIGGLIAYPYVKRLQAKKNAQKKEKEREGDNK